MSASDRALDRRGQAGVDPVAGEKQPSHRRSPCRAAAAVRARARTSRAARESTVPRSSRAARARGQRLEQLARARAAISSSLVRSRRSARAARHERQVRRRRRRTTGRLSNTHCIARPGRPTNGSSKTGRSNHRLTVTIGDDAIAARARGSRLERRRLALEQLGEGKPGHGGHDAPAPASAPRRCDDAATRPPSRARTVAGAPVTHGPAVRSR